MSEAPATTESPSNERTLFDIDPYAHDPTRWATSMAHHAELLVPCLDAARPARVAEVGAFAGDLTRLLLAWAESRGAQVEAIDPAPQPSLEALARESAALTLVREPSLKALAERELADAIVIDGDHNYYTVFHELKTIAERAGETLPLLFFHDLCWPHGRRDDYFDIEAIPAEYRQPIVGEGRGIYPGDPGTRPDGLPYPKSAAREGGERNGVLTAVEDFAREHPQARLAVVPVFFGFGAMWDRNAPYADDLERLLAPFDRNPLLARLEGNRVLQLARQHAYQVEIWRLKSVLQQRERVLSRLLESRAFALAERISRVRARLGIGRHASVVSREEVRRALAGDGASG